MFKLLNLFYLTGLSINWGPLTSYLDVNTNAGRLSVPEELIFSLMKVESTFGKVGNFSFVELDRLDGIGKVLAGGVESDVMGHGKAIGGRRCIVAARGCSSRTGIFVNTTLFKAEDGQRSLGLVAADDLLVRVPHCPDKTTFAVRAAARSF